MKRAMIGLLGTLAFAAAAQTAQPQAPATGTAPAAQQDAVKKPELNDRHCLRDTGTRIRSTSRKDRQCTGAMGSAYTRDDLHRTGEVDIADALRKLDPSIH